jgi:GT2 family glycosyltransferase
MGIIRRVQLASDPSCSGVSALLRLLEVSPVYASIRLGNMIAAAIRRLAPPRLRPFPPAPQSKGISVVIPERGNPGLLGECLTSVEQALAEIEEPAEVIVVVNGSDPADYEGLRSAHGAVCWLFFAEPLGFSGAVRRGVVGARHDWVYLLNSDMLVDPGALRELLPWRAPHVFALASQIFMRDTARRREESGWADFRIERGCVEIFDAQPEDSETTRGSLYAGGGSSLFQRRLLLEIMGKREPYHPFYWDDVEWGVAAWKRGYECLFCPKSTVRHTHRATVAKFYAAGEVEHTFRRNACQFQLRNLEALGSPRALCRRMLGLDRGSFRIVASPRNLSAALLRRVRSARLPFNDRCLLYVRHKYYSVPPGAAAAKPVVLVASPFGLFPPAHGGAVRLNELLGRLGGSFSVVLLSDEAGTYGRESLPYFKRLASVHLIAGRPEAAPGGGDRARIAAHSHDGMQEALERLAACWRPAVVQVEYLELAGLRRPRGRRAPWLLTLHDVPLPAGGAGETIEDRYKRALIRRFDRVVVCSAEDERLLGGGRSALVPNGGRVNDGLYNPSPDSGVLLFAGAFRYRPNLSGIREFLEKVYPALKEEFPAAELWVLGGRDAVRDVEGIACFSQAGVCVFDYVEDVRPYLQRCAVTINPQVDIRGSSIKVMESLAFGRVCVSTCDGARGIPAGRFSGLVTVPRIEDFREPLELLLRDPRQRREIERPPAQMPAECTWERSAQMLAGLYRECIAETGERT